MRQAHLAQEAIVPGTTAVHPSPDRSGGRRPVSLPGHADRKGGLAVGLALLAGVGLVAATAAIHLHLWLSGYRRISTIGPLFLLQAIAGLAIAPTLALSRRPVVVGAAAGYLAATLGGFLLSVYVGLFGFQDTLTAPLAVPALVVEAAGVAVLGLAGALMVSSGPLPSAGRRE